MKKNVLITITSATLLIGVAFAVKAYCFHKTDDLFRANVEALADGEAAVYGKCRNEENSCIAVCGNCGAVYVAVGGNHKGGSYEMSGTCEECEKEF